MIGASLTIMGLVVLWLLATSLGDLGSRQAKKLKESHQLELRERAANNRLWDLCEKDDPQFLKDLGIEMPPDTKTKLDWQFRAIEGDETIKAVLKRNNMLREEAKKFPPREPMRLQQMQGIGSFADMGKHAGAMQQQQRLEEEFHRQAMQGRPGIAYVDRRQIQAGPMSDPASFLNAVMGPRYRGLGGGFL